MIAHLEKFLGQDHFPFVSELDGVVTEVDEDLSQTQRVSDQYFRYLWIMVDEELKTTLLGPVADDVGHVGDHLFEFELRCFEFELVGFDLREVEDVVDDTKQRSGGVMRFGDVVGLHVVEIGLLDEVEHPHDRIHRGADLVAHVGQELRFGFVGFVGCLFGLFTHGDLMTQPTVPVERTGEDECNDKEDLHDQGIVDLLRILNADVLLVESLDLLRTDGVERFL